MPRGRYAAVVEFACGVFPEKNHPKKKAIPRRDQRPAHTRTANQAQRDRIVEGHGEALSTPSKLRPDSGNLRGCIRLFVDSLLAIDPNFTQNGTLPLKACNRLFAEVDISCGASCARSEKSPAATAVARWGCRGPCRHYLDFLQQDHVGIVSAAPPAC